MKKLTFERKDDTAEVTEISHETLPPMPKKSALLFHHTFHPNPKMDLEDAKISQEMQEKLQTLKQDYDNIVSKHNSDIGLTHLQEIETVPELPPVTTKPYPLPLKHHKFVKEEIENSLDAGLIECLISPFAAPIIVVPRKCKPRAPLAETT